MVKGFSGCDASFGIGVEHAGEEFEFGRGGFLFHFVSEVDGAFVIFFYDLGIGAGEKIFVEDELIENGSDTEHVTDGGKAAGVELFILDFENFGSDISCGAAADKEVLGFVCEGGEVKVNDFDFLFGGDENVLGFEIAMKDAFFGHVADGFEDLSQDDGGVVFVE